MKRTLFLFLILLLSFSVLCFGFTRTSYKNDKFHLSYVISVNTTPQSITTLGGIQTYVNHDKQADTQVLPDEPVNITTNQAINTIKCYPAKKSYNILRIIKLIVTHLFLF